MATPKAEMKQIGTLLWGKDNWIVPMARLLKRSDKSIRRYQAGDRDMPADILPKLTAEMVRRRDALAEKISSLGG